ncbi:MAG: redoxin family protein, partial [Planctomycetota bacterium]
KGTDGKDYTLEQFKGKIVVLEWTNYNCPWVIPHYEQGNMQRLQKKYTAKGKDVIWLSIQSTKTNHRQYQKPEQMLATAKKWKAVPTAQLMDPVGKVGTAYGARMTPHMYVINKKGEVVYTGAIDNYRETRNREDLKSNRNYVAEVLDALLAGKTPKVQSTDPYG